MGKKNLDKLFQEKFKEFHEVPDEKVWKAIEASLNKKKRKRVIPIWWKLGGVAAILALALIIWNPFANTVDNSPKVTDTHNGDTENLDDNRQVQEDTLQLPKIANEEVTVTTTDERILDDDTDQDAKGSAADSSGDDLTTKAAQHQEVTHKESSLANSDTKGRDTPQKDSSTSISKDSKNSQLTVTDKKGDKDSRASENRGQQKDVLTGTGNKENEAIATSTDQETMETLLDGTKTVKKKAADIAKNENDPNTSDQNLDSQEGVPPNSEEKVAEYEQNTSDIPEETEPKKKSIFEAVDEYEEEVLAETSDGRWSVGPSIAPVYFDAIGEGSPVNPIFAQNAKSGRTNLSYGLSVAYEVNKKLRIRSGVHKVDYGYNTSDVAFSTTLQASTSEQLKNINYAATSKSLVVKSEVNNFSNLESPDSDLALEVSSATSGSRNGTMAQQFGYLEVPLELNYALIDRKFGVNLIGGVSSLFLLDNSVTLTTGDLTTKIGEANNINTVNFSTNIGFGLNYNFSPKIQLNIEPLFKYQLNTFSEVSGDFQPFSVGVYSGLNFKF